MSEDNTGIINCNTQIVVDKLPLKVKQCIDDIIKKEGYLTNRIDCRTTSTEGGNYLSVLYEVYIKGKTPESDKENNIFVKYTVPVNNTEIISLRDAFGNEAFFYNELAIIFEKLQDNANIPREERYKILRHYYSDTEMVIMENVSQQGFRTPGRMDVVSLSAAEKSVQYLAKFHALSFVLEIENPEIFEKKIKPLEVPWRFNDSWYIFVENLKKLVIKTLDGEHEEKISAYMTTISDNLTNYIKFDSSSKCCLCHGDYRPNNILMREQNGEITSVMPIDYQAIHCGSPTKDFIYFIVTSTDQKFRNEHLDHLKDLYYTNLSGYLSRFNVNPEETYSKEEFERSYQKHLDYGLTTAISVLPFLFVLEDDVPEISDLRRPFNLHTLYGIRFRELIEDFIKWQTF